MLLAVLVMAGIAAGIGLALLLASRRVAHSADDPVEQINALLPQSQCGQCDYPGCRPYAEAIAAGTADINRCAPGGDRTVTALANLLGRSPAPVDPRYGTPGPALMAVIDEAACIGCTLCIAACPVDAIIGAAQLTHTVVRDECTGCELCVAPCPVDCIAIVPRRQALAAVA